MTLEERFWSKVRKRPDGCWEWTAARNHRGYGKFSTARSRWTSAHRVAYELVCGPIPAGLHVCHRCDRPWCVNPEHLFVGDQKANIDDMHAKRRGRYAARHPTARLNPAAVVEIRAAVRRGVTQSQLARRFGVTQECISRVVLRKSWAYVP